VTDVHIPIQHIIGTVALIGLVVSAGLAYTIMTSYIERDILEQQLKQVSEIVALNIVEIVNLANFANFGNLTRNGTMIRTLDLPSDIGGKSYAVQLVDQTSQNQGYDVISYLSSEGSTRATSEIPINSTQSSVQLVTSGPPITCWIEVGKEAVTSSTVVYGGNNNTVVWAWKEGDVTHAGLGILHEG
jgi:hypothetical protein